MRQAVALSTGLFLASLAISPAAGSDLDLPFDDLDDLLAGEIALLAAEDVVVSAVRHAQPIEESPSAITVITRQQILASGYHDLPDLLRLVPGADVFRISQGLVSVGIRSRSTHGGDRLLVLVDGRDVMSHFLGVPQWATMPFGVESIDRIEIIRGPASTLYGANALQGVVNIVTRPPDDGPIFVETKLTGADARTFGGDVAAHGARGALSYWASAGYEERGRYDGFGDRAFLTLRGRLQGRWRIDEDRRVLVEAGVSHADGELHLIDLGPGFFAGTWPYLRASAEIGRTHLSLVADHLDSTFGLDLPLRLPPDEDGNPGRTIGEVPTLYHPASSVEVAGHHSLDLFEGNRLTGGASLRAIRHHPGSVATCPDVGPQDFDPDECVFGAATETRAGLFLQDEWRLTEHLTLTTGLRLDHNSLNPEPGISPRAALVWRALDDHAFRVSYGRAYRKPTYLQSSGHVMIETDPDGPLEIAHRIQHIFATQIGNPTLPNEKADAFEVGWRGRFLDGRLVATVDLFHGRYHDAIWFELRDFDLRPGFGGAPQLPDGATARYESAEGTDISYGGEATVTVQPVADLTLSASYALDWYLYQVEGPEGDLVWERLRIEPDHRVIASARYALPANLGVGLDVFWSSTYRVHIADPISMLEPRRPVRVGGRPMVNASVRYERAVGPVALELGVVALNVPDLDVYDQPHLDLDDGPFGAERLSRRVRLFVRGRY